MKQTGEYNLMVALVPTIQVQECSRKSKQLSDTAAGNGKVINGTRMKGELEREQHGEAGMEEEDDWDIAILNKMHYKERFET